MKSSAKKLGRIDSLDYLRGYFICVIIIDHLWKFPSLWMFFTGQAKLWMTAAEGFVMISGFLIGYIRGYKAQKLPFSDVRKKLLTRALLLYCWMVLMSIIFIAIDWHIPAIPYVPSSPAAVGDWPHAIWLTITGTHPHTWVHFLWLYTIFLVMSVPIVWLLRRKLPYAVLAITIAVYILGQVFNVEWMKWQLLFFGMALIGFYFDSLRIWWSGLVPLRKKLFVTSLYSATILTLSLSVVCTFYPTLLADGVARSLNNLFVIESFPPARVLLALLWFTALAYTFERIIKFLRRTMHGFLDFIGTRSLSAYIIHGLVICVINVLVVTLGITESFFVNTLLGAISVLTVYGLLRIPIVSRIIPK